MAEPFYSDYLLDREPDAAGRQLSQLLWGIFLTPVMLTVADLGIPGVLADKALTAEEIAAAAGTDPDATGRLLRAAVATGLLAADSSSRFTLTEMGNWLRPEVSSFVDMAGYWQPPMVNAMGVIADHVRTGRKVDPAAPGGIWEYLSERPQDAARFSRAMSFFTSRELAALTAADYRPPACQRIVDVGGNRGTMLAWLLRAVPEATGVLFDLPASLAAAPDYLAVQGVADRTELAAGSFLSEVPEGDLHVLSNVLHNWDDDNVRLLAGNCARSAPPDGWLIVIEPVLPSGPEPALGHLIDILMMTLIGGRERTREEHRALIEPAGYAYMRDVPLALGSSGAQAPWRVLEFRRLSG
jgi:hypothetical protein